MKSTFNNLSEIKKQKIIDACIQEFGEYGYESSSMDGIIKRAGISKGGLYGYISSKRELFLYIVDCAYSRLYVYLRSRIESDETGIETDLLDRLRHVASCAIDFYLEQPETISLLVQAVNIPDEELSLDTSLIFEKHYFGLFGDTTEKELQYPKSKVMELSMWLLQKTRMDFLNEIKKEKDPDVIKRDYMENWIFISVL